jgi:lambda family phage tail tape measure protein
MSTETLNIKVDTADAVKSTNALTKSLDKLEKEGDQTTRSMKKVSGSTKLLSKAFGALSGVAVAGILVGTFKRVISATIKQENAIAQLDARLKSTGGAVGFLSQEIQDYASALQQSTTFGDEAILEMQGVLLTFTQVTGEEFKGATEAVLNLSTVMGTDLKSSAIQIGKALNDPIKGLSALTRAGIQFNKEQKETIKLLAETGHVAEAQTLILEELETQFGGAAEAARDTLGGALASLSNTWSDLFEGTADDAKEFIKYLKELEVLLGNKQTIEGFEKLRKGAFAFTKSLVAAGIAMGDLADRLEVGGKKWAAFATGDFSFLELFTLNAEEAASKIEGLERTTENSINVMLTGSKLLALSYFELNKQMAQGSEQARHLHDNVVLLSDKEAALEKELDGVQMGLSMLAHNGLPETSNAVTTLSNRVIELVSELNQLRITSAALNNQAISYEEMGPPRDLMNAPAIIKPPVIIEPPTIIEPPLRGGGRGAGGGKSQAQKDAESLEKSFNSLYESLNPLVKLSREYSEDTNILNNALEKQLATSDQIVLAQATLDEEYVAAKEAITGLTEATSIWGDVAETAVNDFASGFSTTLVDGIMEGELAFDEFARSFLANIAQMIIEAQILAAIKSITGVVAASAKGNVIQAGEVLPFAKGGVVSSPTVFPMANGIGLMGEAGPEAIMPLKRGNDGRLGVEVTKDDSRNSVNSGDITVNQTFEFNGSGGGDQIMQLRAEGNRIKVETLAAVENSIRRGGSMARAVGRKQ